MLLFLFPLTVNAATVAQVGDEKTQIRLTDEPCALTEQITNLPKRAVWIEGGKSVEGCYGVIPGFGIVTMYFADKTTAAVPVAAFTRASDT